MVVRFEGVEGGGGSHAGYAMFDLPFGSVGTGGVVARYNGKVIVTNENYRCVFLLLHWHDALCSANVNSGALTRHNIMAFIQSEINALR